MSSIVYIFMLLGNTTEFDSNENTNLALYIMIFVFLIFIGIIAISSVFNKKDDDDDQEIKTNTDNEQKINTVQTNTLSTHAENTSSNDDTYQNSSYKNKESNPTITFFDTKVVMMFIVSAVFVLIGFFKRFIYIEGERYYGTSVNYYVGADAYNFIINSNHMIAYFILALVFAFIACTLLILNAIIFYNSSSNRK